MVTISNGFSKFHLSAAASAVYSIGKLSKLITGSYPTKLSLKILKLFFSTQKINRLLDRRENIPENLIFSLFLSEAIFQIGQKYSNYNGFKNLCDLFSYKLYGLQALKLINTISDKTKIYHYRAGFGGVSVGAAKRKGMITLCDHSIVHPNVVDLLVENNGKILPNKTVSKVSDFWKYILKDIEQADDVLVNSDFVKETFIAQGWDRSNIHVIYLGVDDNFMQTIPTSSICKYKDTKTMKFFTNAMDYRKGVDVLIPALEEINDLGFEIEIAGNINNEIERKYSNFFSKKNVKVLGLVRRSDLAKHMANADVFIFPSFAEGSARIVFEALACGCFVITTPNSGSIVKNNVHGFIVPPGDKETLKNAIHSALANPDRVNLIGKRNSKLITENYRQYHYGEKLNHLYMKLLKTHHKKYC